jgi:hypothetical protein
VITDFLSSRWYPFRLPYFQLLGVLSGRGTSRPKSSAFFPLLACALRLLFAYLAVAFLVSPIAASSCDFSCGCATGSLTIRSLFAHSATGSWLCGS